MILTSGNFDESVKAAAEIVGVREFLNKPHSTKSLRDSLGRVLPAVEVGRTLSRSLSSNQFERGFMAWPELNVLPEGVGRVRRVRGRTSE
ncbi:MAG: hypothetical protein M2R45_03001 [Verrucomicrobia subdivision 3 bacterium]|nr:hypothetical protein [Limisphaerales bacterium]MCS1416513.1 hypothetical protein [Limisphaerales bacterium]